jgi:hypothetical protein
LRRIIKIPRRNHSKRYCLLEVCLNTIEIDFLLFYLFEYLTDQIITVKKMELILFEKMRKNPEMKIVIWQNMRK